jgi:hypothetical protein
MWKSTIDVEQACRTFCAPTTALAQHGLHAGNMHFNTQNGEYYNLMRIFTWVFFYTSCAFKIS